MVQQKAAPQKPAQPKCPAPEQAKSTPKQGGEKKQPEPKQQQAEPTDPSVDKQKWRDMVGPDIPLTVDNGGDFVLSEPEEKLRHEELQARI